MSARDYTGQVETQVSGQVTAPVIFQSAAARVAARVMTDKPITRRSAIRLVVAVVS